MSVISINNRDLYDRIGSGEITPSEFTKYLKPLTLFNESATDRDRWAALLYVGVFGFQKDELEPEFKKLGIWDPSNNEEGNFEGILGFTRQAFSHRGRDQGSVFSKIYEKLEELRTFER